MKIIISYPLTLQKEKLEVAKFTIVHVGGFHPTSTKGKVEGTSLPRCHDLNALRDRHQGRFWLGPAHRGFGTHHHGDAPQLM